MSNANVYIWHLLADHHNNRFSMLSSDLTAKVQLGVNWFRTRVRTGDDQTENGQLNVIESGHKSVPASRWFLTVSVNYGSLMSWQ